MHKFCVCLLPVFMSLANAYNILVVFPFVGKSHILLYMPLINTLASKGHNVTLISYHSPKNNISNFREILLGDVSRQNGPEFLSIENLPQFGWIGGVPFLGKYHERACSAGYASKSFQEFLREDNQFDLVLMQFFVSECFMGIVKRYNAPYIGLSSNLILPWFFDWLGSPNNPSYMPDMNMEFSQNMNFFERIENTFCHLYYILGHKYVLEPIANKYSKKYLGIDLTENRDIYYNVSLMFAPTHFTTFGAHAMVPNLIEVGGIQIQPPRGLPKDFHEYINKSTDGVIYFSMGSTLKGNTFPKEKRDAFLKNFKQLPQNVIWKWESETMEGKPDNVLLSKWTPQFEIICNPNVKAFIYHGGLLSSSEAVYCGVPQIIIPQFGDQFRNAKALESSGIAVIMKMTEITEEAVKEALEKVLNPQFQKRAREISERYKDRPLSPLDTAVYWIEYVAKHKGADFMRSGAVNMPFYQYCLLDVIAFTIVVFTLVLLALYFILRKLCTAVLRRILIKRKTE